MRYKFQLIVGAFIFVYLLVSALVLNFYNDLAMKDAKKEAYYVLEGINSVREYIAGVQRPLIEQLKEQGILKEIIATVSFTSGISMPSMPYFSSICCGAFALL